MLSEHGSYLHPQVSVWSRDRAAAHARDYQSQIQPGDWGARHTDRGLLLSEVWDGDGPFYLNLMTPQVNDCSSDEAWQGQSDISRCCYSMEENIKLIFHLSIADRFGDYHENEVGGFYSRVLQHEIDHLFGRLFVNKMVHSSTDNCDIGHLLLSWVFPKS